MTVTIDSPFKAPPRISETVFVSVLADKHSFESDALWLPTLPSGRRDAAKAIYHLIVSHDHDPAVWLAILGKESTYGTNQSSVLWRNQTHSWTNARTVRNPLVKQRAEIIHDWKRDSDYVRYRDVYDSVLDGLYRVDEPGYAYRKANAASVVEHIRIWAPGSDANKPEQYAQTMCDWINQWMAAEPVKEPPMAGDDARFEWVPDEHEFGYPERTHGRGGHDIDLLAIHTTEGTDSRSWLRDQHGSSATYLTDRMFLPRCQFVRESDAPWTGGSRVYNQRGIHIEFEHKAGEPITAEHYRNAAETCLPILKRNNIPLTYLGRDNGPGKRGIIGHADIPDPNDPGLWGGDGNHTDPTDWNWDAFMDALHALGGTEVAGVDDEVTRLNGHEVRLGFRDHFLEVGAAVYPDDPVKGGIAVFGNPLGNEFKTSFGSAQRFERYTLEWHRDNAPPFDIIGTLRGEEEPEVA